MEQLEHSSPKKPRLVEVYARSGIGYRQIDRVVNMAQVPRFVFNEMLLGQPVAPQDADRVLAIINDLSASDLTSTPWTFENVDIPVLPVSEVPHE